MKDTTMTTMEFPEIIMPTAAEPAAAKTPSAIASGIVAVQGEVAKFDQIAAGLAAIETAHPKNVIVAAIDTPAGMKLAEAGWRAYRNPRLQVEAARKAAKAPVLALGKAIDAFAGDLEAQLTAGEKNYKSQVTAEEDRREAVKAEAARKEAARLGALRLVVDGILAGWFDRCKTDGMTADRVQAGINALTAAPMPTDPGLQDVADHWESAKLLTLGKMERIRLDLERAEAARVQAEIDRQRAELARQAADLAAQHAESERLERLADENRKRLASEAHRADVSADLQQVALMLVEPPPTLLHAREAAAAIATARPAPSTPAPITEDARIDPRRSTLALCREALEMLVGDDAGIVNWTESHTLALTEAVDAFEAAATR